MNRIILNQNQKITYNRTMKLTTTQINELKIYLKDKEFSQFHRRLQVVLFRAEGLTYEEITTLIGFSKYAIWSLTRNT